MVVTVVSSTGTDHFSKARFVLILIQFYITFVIVAVMNVAVMNEDATVVAVMIVAVMLVPVSVVMMATCVRFCVCDIRLSRFHRALGRGQSGQPRRVAIRAGPSA